MKLWKALFYCVWYSDKVAIQQELIFAISRLTRSIGRTTKGEAADSLARRLLFLRTFFLTMFREWMGLDHHRIDKYLSLIRRMTHECLVILREFKWEERAVAGVAELFRDPILCNQPNGVRYHVTDVLVDEIAAAIPDVTTPQLQRLLAPFYTQCIKTDDRFLFERVCKEVMGELASRVEAAQASHEEGEGGGAGAGGAGEMILSPLMGDAEERAASIKRAFKKVTLPPLARDAFSMAGSRYDRQPPTPASVHVNESECVCWCDVCVVACLIIITCFTSSHSASLSCKSNHPLSLAPLLPLQSHPGLTPRAPVRRPQGLVSRCHLPPPVQERQGVEPLTPLLSHTHSRGSHRTAGRRPGGDIGGVQGGGTCSSSCTCACTTSCCREGKQEQEGRGASCGCSCTRWRPETQEGGEWYFCNQGGCCTCPSCHHCCATRKQAGTQGSGGRTCRGE